MGKKHAAPGPPGPAPIAIKGQAKTDGLLCRGGKLPLPHICIEASGLVLFTHMNYSSLTKMRTTTVVKKSARQLVTTDWYFGLAKFLSRAPGRILAQFTAFWQPCLASRTYYEIFSQNILTNTFKHSHHSRAILELLVLANTGGILHLQLRNCRSLERSL